MDIKGQCACGRTRYRVKTSEPPDVANCHCRLCRETTGGTFVTWATVPRADFVWTGGRPRSYQSTRHGRRYFCPACGTQLALFTTRSPRTIDITVASLRHPENFPPNRHIWTRDMLPWLALDDHLPREKGEDLSIGQPPPAPRRKRRP